MCKLLLLAFVGLAASASVHQKTEEDAKEDRQAYAINYCANYMWPTGNYPYPTDCRKYISCANGVTNVMPCPATTVYNPNLRVCDNPQNVPTCNYNAPANVNPIYLNNYCTANGYGNGMYFHPYDCSSYINCNYGVTTVSGCRPAPCGTLSAGSVSGGTMASSDLTTCHGVTSTSSTPQFKETTNQVITTTSAHLTAV